MVAAPVSLTSGSDATNASSYATASIAPSANKLILAAVSVRKGTATASTPTLTGCGLTWVQVATVINSTNVVRLTLFRAMSASPSSGAVTIDLGGVTHNHCLWSICEFGSVDTSGTNGSGAVVQSVTKTQNAINSITGTLAAFGSANNATYGAFNHDNNEATTHGSGFTDIHDVINSENETLFTERNLANDTTVDASWATSGNGMVIAVEIKDAPVIIHRRRTLGQSGTRAGSRAA